MEHVIFYESGKDRESPVLTTSNQFSIYTLFYCQEIPPEINLIANTRSYCEITEILGRTAVRIWKEGGRDGYNVCQ